jgi:hypothetical protein
MNARTPEPIIFERSLAKGERRDAALDALDAICMAQPRYQGGNVQHDAGTYLVSTHTIGNAIVINTVTTERKAHTRISGNSSQDLVDALDALYE